MTALIDIFTSVVTITRLAYGIILGILIITVIGVLIWKLKQR